MNTTQPSNGKVIEMNGQHTITSERGIQLYTSSELGRVIARYNSYRRANLPCQLRLAVNVHKPTRTHLETLEHCLTSHQSYTWAKLSEKVECTLSVQTRHSLGQLAVGLGIPILRSESKQSVADAIRRMIYTRKESFQRTKFHQSSVSFG